MGYKLHMFGTRWVWLAYYRLAAVSLGASLSVEPWGSTLTLELYRWGLEFSVAWKGVVPR